VVILRISTPPLNTSINLQEYKGPDIKFIQIFSPIFLNLNGGHLQVTIMSGLRICTMPFNTSNG
jgi:hypothetical protein